MKMANWNVWKYMFIRIPIPYDFVYPSDIGTTASKSDEKGHYTGTKGTATAVESVFTFSWSRNF